MLLRMISLRFPELRMICFRICTLPHPQKFNMALQNLFQYHLEISRRDA